MNFEELNISNETLKAIRDMEFTEPTPIQEKVIPLQMEKRDIIGQAQTGTGKTAAFSIPLIEKLIPRYYKDGNHTCDALIITPTRELALQVEDEIQKIGQYKKISSTCVYGGVPIEPQIRLLRRGMNIVVATPGRALDHISRGTMNLSGVRYFILDEADEMLDMGFIDDIKKILFKLPEKRQMLLFSATMPSEIKKLAEKFMNNPQHISVSNQQIIVPKIEQIVYYVENNERFEALCRVLDQHQPEMSIVFCQTKREVDNLYNKLTERNYQVEALHGDFSQYQRDQVMQRFRGNEIDILIATDLAARGLDVSHVSMVINYCVPQNSDNYIHRIGRTGRAGRDGKAVTLATNEDYKTLQSIQKLIKRRLKSRSLPTQEELYSTRKQGLGKRLDICIESKEKSDFVNMANNLLEKNNPTEILAASLKLAFDSFYPALKVDRKNELNSINTGAERGMVRFYLNGGRNHQLSTRDLLRTITGKTTIPSDKIGKIRILDEFTFIEIAQNHAEDFLKDLSIIKINGININVQPARAKSKTINFKDSRGKTAFNQRISSYGNDFISDKYSRKVSNG